MAPHVAANLLEEVLKSGYLSPCFSFSMPDFTPEFLVNKCLRQNRKILLLEFKCGPLAPSIHVSKFSLMDINKIQYRTYMPARFIHLPVLRLQAVCDVCLSRVPSAG